MDKFRKMTAEICHSAEFSWPPGDQKRRFLISFWCPGTHPETSGDPRRPERSPKRIQGGARHRFYTIFRHLLAPVGTSRGRLLAYFSVFSRYFCHFFGDSFPEHFLASFLDGSVTHRTLKTWPNHCSVARKHSSPKIQKVGPGDRCCFHFGHLLELFCRHFRPLERQNDVFYGFGFPEFF